jgi:hypothetical protein
MSNHQKQIIAAIRKAELAAYRAFGNSNGK